MILLVEMVVQVVVVEHQALASALVLGVTQEPLM
tara:strand:+ start:176 stop:277 length:102 start_codon:yes stop_codon:yes gene_type:complete